MTHTILLVEDELELREMITEALEMNGFKVVAASDGQDALERLAGIEHICLVLLDLLMPRMNGWDFYDELRARPDHAAVPVIIHSSSPTQIPAGVARVIQKPMEYQRLVAVAKEFCSP